MSCVIVIGAGYAGLAAAYAAARAGARTTLIVGRAGASELGSGALDLVPWSERERAASVPGAGPLLAGAIDAQVSDFIDHIGIFTLPEGGGPLATLATTAGALRVARGHDRALLDLGAHPGSTVCLPRVGRAGWDADSLARAFGASSHARSLDLRFVAFDAQLHRFTAERTLGDADLAHRHDDPARLAWLAARLQEGLSRVEGRRVVLLGPWLGLDEPRAAALEAALGLPAGEALVGVGSPAGMRFMAARDRQLWHLDVRRVDGAAARVDRGDGGYRVSLRGEREPLVADAVVLAIGGLVGGGVVYEPADYAAGSEGADRANVPFRLSVEVAASLALGGAPLDVVSSLQGPDLTAAWPRGSRAGDLEAVGVSCDARGAVFSIGAGLYAAGDVIAGRPRTAIAAIQSGLIAGASAAATTPAR